MSESTPTSELVNRLAKESGITKKLATEILRAIPEIVEDALMKGGEVRIRGLGTFRMKWTQGRIGRNPKTGQIVGIPPHDRLVFLPEQSLKDYINRDYRLLSYKVIPGSEALPGNEEEISEFQTIIEPDAGFSSLSEEERNVEFPPETEKEPTEEIDYSYEPGPELTVRRRNNRWIVPAVLGIIAVLSVAFYFRNFHDGGRRSAVGGQQSAVSGQQSAVSGQQSAVGGQQSAVGSQQSEISNQKSPDTVSVKPAPSEKSFPIENQPSTIDNRQSIRITGDNHLYQLARETYGNPLLWVLIYKANQDKISNPDKSLAGMELIIPALEGKPGKLSHHDSLEVSEGYRLVSEYYKSKGDPKADDFQQVCKKYLPH